MFTQRPQSPSSFFILLEKPWLAFLLVELLHNDAFQHDLKASKRHQRKLRTDAQYIVEPGQIEGFL